MYYQITGIDKILEYNQALKMLNIMALVEVQNHLEHYDIEDGVYVPKNDKEYSYVGLDDWENGVEGYQFGSKLLLMNKIEDEEDNFCSLCSGTGEGMWEISRCTRCKGKGY